MMICDKGLRAAGDIIFVTARKGSHIPVERPILRNLASLLISASERGQFSLSIPNACTSSLIGD